MFTFKAAASVEIQQDFKHFQNDCDRPGFRNFTVVYFAFLFVICVPLSTSSSGKCADICLPISRKDWGCKLKVAELLFIFALLM